MVIPLDALDPILAEVGYGQLGRFGALGYDPSTVVVDGTRYASALSTHPPARVLYGLEGRHGSFTCRVALNDDVPPGRSHANFTVLADGRRAAEALRVRAGDPPRLFEADITGASMLELTVTTSEWPWCHAVWLEPVLAAGEGPAPAPKLVTDPLRRVDIVVPTGLRPVDRCIATVASRGYEQWADDMLGSVLAYGNCPDARLVVFALDDSAGIASLASKYGALLVRCHPRRRPDPTSKALLYAIPHVIPAARYVCLDADMLVLGDLGPVFAAIDACPPGSVLICGEGNDHGLADLGAALEVAYGGGPDPPFFSRAEPLARYPLVVNDGLFAAGRDALIRLGAEVAGLPGVVHWVDERRDIQWRNQFALNVALARLDAAVELDPTWNVQLHAQDVEPAGPAVRPGARWRGRDVRILHFSGRGKFRQADLRRRLRAPADPLANTSGEDGYAVFTAALRCWVGRRGLNALAGSLLGTADGQSGRAHDPAVFPPFAALHHLVLANGCVRVLHTGTDRGSRLSTGCMATAVAHRAGGLVVTFGAPAADGEDFLALLPAKVRGCIEVRAGDSLEEIEAAIARGEQFHAALLDSSTTAERLGAELELASRLVVDGGLILLPGLGAPGATAGDVLARIEGAGVGVVRLWSTEDGVPEDDGLGLAVLENRRLPAPAGADLLRRRPWKTVTAPEDAMAVPSMLSDRERALLYWLAREYYSGAGRIVDGGSFLGGSTVALAAGLRDRADLFPSAVIVSYDRFLVEAYTLEDYGGSLPVAGVGASFRGAFDTNVGPLASWVEVREGDLCQWGWSGEPIEILFLDIVKTWDVNDVVVSQFFPSLVPGRSVIVQQDYLWGSCPWIHLTMELLAGSFEILDAMPNGSVVYLYRDPVPEELLGVRLRTWAAGDLRDLMQRAVDRWSGDERGLVELAGVMLTAELSGPVEAGKEFASVRAAYEEHPRVQHCAGYLAREMGW